MEKPVSVLVVEDEIIIADFVQDCLQNLGYEVSALCISYDEAVKALAEKQPDIALVDITLKGNKTGIDLAHFIKDNYKVPIIFASSHNGRETIDAAKRTLPYAYLIKPFDEDDLYAVIETALTQHRHRNAAQAGQPETSLHDEPPLIIRDSIFVRVKNRFVKVPLEDLEYAEANDNYATLFTSNSSYILKTTLKTLVDVLPSQFWRIHRSYLINLHHLKSFDTNTVWVGNKSLPIGKSFYPLLAERLHIIHG